MDGMPQGAREGGAAMRGMYGQKFAPAISALPPSMVVVCHKEPGMDGQKFAPRQLLDLVS